MVEKFKTLALETQRHISTRFQRSTHKWKFYEIPWQCSCTVLSTSLCHVKEQRKATPLGVKSPGQNVAMRDTWRGSRMHALHLEPQQVAGSYNISQGSACYKLPFFWLLLSFSLCFCWPCLCKSSTDLLSSQHQMQDLFEGFRKTTTSLSHHFLQQQHVWEIFREFPWFSMSLWEKNVQHITPLSAHTLNF